MEFKSYSSRRIVVRAAQVVAVLFAVAGSVKSASAQTPIPTPEVLLEDHFRDPATYPTSSQVRGSKWYQYTAGYEGTQGRTEWGEPIIDTMITETISPPLIKVTPGVTPTPIPGMVNHLIKLRLSTAGARNTSLLKGTNLSSINAYGPPALGQAIDFESRLSVDSGAGVVGAMFTYGKVLGKNSTNQDVAFSDEIDYEYVGGNTYAPTPNNEVLVTAWHDWQRKLPDYSELPNAPYNNRVNHHSQDVGMSGIDKTQLHFLKMHWTHTNSGYAIQWFAKQGYADPYQLVAVEPSQQSKVQPQKAMNFMFNIWAPGSDWNAAFDSTLTPTSNSNSPRVFDLTLCYARVTRYPIDPTISTTTSGLVQGTATGNAIVSPPLTNDSPTSPPVSSSTWKALDISTGSNGNSSLLWLKPDNSFQVWNVNDNGVQTQNSPVFAPAADSSGSWTPKRVGVAGDGLTRLLLVRTDGAVAIWTLNSSLGFGSSTAAYGPLSGWGCQDMAVASDGTLRLLWSQSNGTFAVWSVAVDGTATSSLAFGPYSDSGGTWSASKISVGGDGNPRVLLKRSDGAATVWTLNGLNFGSSAAAFGPYTNFGAAALALNTSTSSDNKRHLMWISGGNAAALWRLSTNDALTIPSALEINASYGPYWTPQAFSVGGDNQMRVLWTNPDGRVNFWKLSAQPDGSASSIVVNTTFGPLP